MTELSGGASSGVTASLFDPAVQSCPFEFYRQLHQHSPVYRLPGSDMWIVSAYDDLREVLSDPARFSSQSNFGSGLQRGRTAAYQDILEEKGWRHVATLQRSDPPEHTRYRKLLNRVFTARRVAGLASHIDGIADELIDAFIGQGRCDFMHDFALQLPGIVICEQLGLSRRELWRFKDWADAMLAMSTRVLDDDELRATAENEAEAQRYFAVVFERRRAEPADDLMSALVHAGIDGEEPLSMHELDNHFCLGAALARQELRSSFTATLARLDDIELDGDLPDPAHHPSMFFLPMKALPLRFTAKSPDSSTSTGTQACK